MANVRSSGTAEVAEIAARVAEAPEAQRQAFLFFLEQARSIPDVVLKCRNQGVSGHCLDRDGKDRECFHFAILAQDDALVVYQLASALDTRNVFSRVEPGKSRARSGRISGSDPDQNQYVADIFRRAYDKLRMG